MTQHDVYKKFFTDVIIDFFTHWKNSLFVLRFIQAATFLVFSLTVNYYAVRYATERAGPSIPDTLFSLLPRLDMSFTDYYVALYLQYVVFLLVVLMPKYSVFFMKCLALLILVRSFFVNLTQLGIPEGVVPTVSFFTQGGDLFFSGHTALPFLVALIFWDIKLIRIIFISLSVFMGVSVILGHYHYSIDVFAAPFITYGVFVIAKTFFKKDYALMLK